MSTTNKSSASHIDHKGHQQVYWEKSVFVRMLSKALSEADIVEQIEYKHIKAQYSEFLKVSYPGGKVEFIDVTADSCKSIFLDIARELNKQPPIGQILDQRHRELVEEWWDACE